MRSTPTTPTSCDERQLRFEQLAFESALASLDADERAHLAGCEACSAQLALVEQLIAEAQSARTATLSPQLRASACERATRALRARQPGRMLGAKSAAPLAAALLALPVAVAHGWLWTQLLERVLGPWLPAALLGGLTLFHAASAALALGGLYAALPFALAYANRNRLEAR
jgi:hypothetical protein